MLLSSVYYLERLRDLSVFMVCTGPEIRQGIEQRKFWFSLQNWSKILLSNIGIESEKSLSCMVQIVLKAQPHDAARDLEGPVSPQTQQKICAIRLIVCSRGPPKHAQGVVG